MIERAEKISPATVGLTIAEGKALLASLQKQIVTAQVEQHVASMKSCPQCGNAFRTKGYYQSTLCSVYGNVGMRIRRLMSRCNQNVDCGLGVFFAAHKTWTVMVLLYINRGRYVRP